MDREHVLQEYLPLLIQLQQIQELQDADELVFMQLLAELVRRRRARTRGQYVILDKTPLIMAIFRGDINVTKKHLRVSPASYRHLVRILPQQKRHGWRKDFEVMVFLFWLAAGISYPVTCAMFNIPRSTTFQIVTRILNKMMDLVQTVITIPTDPENLRAIGANFARMAGSDIFQNCVGAIDGCHIRVMCPPDLHNENINRKLFYLVHLQGVVDNRGMFVNIFAGFPGSAHDSRVLRHSSLYRDATFPPAGYFILGDKGYPCRRRPITIITPYREPMNKMKRRFNYSLSKARIVVERAFREVQVRWRSIFTKALEVKLEKCTKVIVACTIMHNICVDEGEIIHGAMNENRSENVRVVRNEEAGEQVRNLMLQLFIAEQQQQQ